MKLIDLDKVYESACAGCTRHGNAPGECYHDEPCERLVVAFTTAEPVDAVVLPCKLGTTLYRICEEGRGRKPFIREVTFNRTNFARIVLDNEVGRTVFLAREEAEAALAKMKGLEVGA